MRAWTRLALVGIACLGCVWARAGESVSVAAAANLTYVLKPLDAAFQAGHPGVVVTSATAASGTLVAQITNGAPYDVFLSADLDYPQKLIKAGGAEQSSLVTFAFGKLVLWTTRAGVTLTSVAEAVGDPGMRKIAVANPRTAPYGRAAMETLARLKLKAAAEPKIIYGENISMTAHYVSSGNADLGFVALSLVAAPTMKSEGSWLEVPAGLYSPIAQGAVITRHGAANSAARSYIEFLRSPAARSVFQRFGYGLP